MIALYSFFLIIAVPLTGFVALSIKLQRESFRREQEANKQSWKGAHSYRSIYSHPPKRLF